LKGGGYVSKRIKGITIELDGETRGLDKALQGVNKRSRDLQGELRDVERLLKFDPGNVEALTQKQRLLVEQVENTTDKLDQLKSAQSQVEDSFKSGQIGIDQYRAFKREIGFTEAELGKFKNKLDLVDDGNSLDNLKKDFKDVAKKADEAKQAVKDMGSEVGSVIGGLAAGGGIAGAVSQALDTSSMNTKIEISMEVPEESKAAVKDAINTVSSYGVDAESALEGVRRQWTLNKDTSDEVNAAIVKGAGTIAAAYSGIDFTELIQETNEISRELNISNEDALGLTNSLLKLGFPPEQLDIIAEYGKQLSDAGFNAQEVQAVMAAGVETGTWNIDNLLDGLKEGRIKLAEFGQEVPKSTKELLANTKISSKQLQEWGKAVAKGGDSGRKAMQDVTEALLNVKDESQRNALGVQFFGTMWEEQGTNITDTIQNMDQHLKTAKENQDQLNESNERLNADPAVQMKQAFSDLKIALEPLLLMIADLITKIADWVSNNPQLAATITAIVTALGIFVGICMALAPIFVTLSGIATAFGVSLGAIMGPVLLVIGIIAALIAIGIALWKNWDTVKEKAIEIWEAMSEWFSGFFETLKGLFNAALDWIDEKTDGKFSSITDAIRSYMNMVWDNIKAVWDYIKNSFKNAVDYIVALVTGDFEGMKDAVEAQMENVWELITSIWDNVMGFLDGIDLMDMGEQIIQGLIDGIKGMASSVVKSVSGVVGDAIEGAKNLLGIHSPSRVFMEIGEFTGEGFQIGINSMIRDIQKASENMSEASIPTIPKFQKPKLKTSDSSNTNDNVKGQGNQLSFERMFEGAVFNVREEQDIEKIAKLLNDYIKLNARKGGVIIG